MSCFAIEGVRFRQRRRARASRSAPRSDRWCATCLSMVQKHRLQPALTRPPAPMRVPRLGRAASTTAYKWKHALSSNSRWARSERIVARPCLENGRGSLVPRTAMKWTERTPQIDTIADRSRLDEAARYASPPPLSRSYYLFRPFLRSWRIRCPLWKALDTRARRARRTEFRDSPFCSCSRVTAP